jgi:hypothetical protein
LKIFTFLLLLATIFAKVLFLSTRSIWVDEAMLLRSIYDVHLNQVFSPLRFYDQAAPSLVILAIKLISEIAITNFDLFRILIFFQQSGINITTNTFDIQKTQLSWCFYIYSNLCIFNQFTSILFNRDKTIWI